MRFKLDKPVRESDYRKTRTIYKFLWFPRKINYEIRWLEGAMIEQVVDREMKLDADCCWNYWYKYYWRDVRFMDIPANLK